MQWGKRIRWALAGIAILILVALLGGYLFIRTNAFHEYALHKLEQQASQATGARIQIRSLDWSLSTLTAHLSNIVIHCTEAPNEPPLLQVDELTVGLTIQSVLHRKVSLSKLLIRHPVAHMQVARGGKNNLPKAPPNNGSHTSIFDLAIGRFSISDGEVDYNDRKTPLNAELYDLRSEVKFDSSLSQYSGTIGYRDGQLIYAQYAPMTHSLRANFTVTPLEFSLQSAVIQVASSTVFLHADVSNFGNPTVTGDYDVHLHTQDFSSLSPSAKPAGDLRTAGKIQYQNQNDLPFLRALVVSGEIQSDGLSAVSPDGKLDVRKLRARYDLTDGNLHADAIEVDTLGGRISADAEVLHLDATPRARVRATIHSISLHEAQQSVRQAQTTEVAIQGTLDGSTEAAWTGSVSSLRLRSDLTVRGAASDRDRNSIGNRKTTKNSRVPVDAVIHAMYDAPSQRLSLRQTRVQIPSMTLTADGEISRHSSLQLHAEGSDLHQLVLLAASFGSTQSAPPTVSGSATLDARVQGSIDQPQMSGRMNGRDLHVEGSQWKSAALNFTAGPSQVTISNGSLVGAKQGRVSFDAQVGLHNWAYTADRSIQANLSAQQLSVADLQHIARLQYPVSGELSAKVALQGTQLSPSGSGSVNIVNARAYGEPLQTFALKFQASNGSVTSTLIIATNAGSANTTLTYTPKTRAYKVKLDAPSIALQKLRTLQAKLAMAGTISASASGEGTLDNPQLNAVIRIPTLTVKDKIIGDVKALVQVADKRANFALDSQVSQASVKARGQVDLAPGYQTEASIDTGAIPLAALLSTFSTSVPAGLQGETELHASLKGPLSDKSRIEAHVTIPKLSASYQQLQIGAVAPIRADFVRSVLTVQPAEIRGTGTSLRVQGSIPFAGSSMPNLTAQGSLDMRIIRILSPDVQSSGVIALDVRATGSPSNPSVEGQVRLQDISLLTESTPLGVEKLNGLIAINNDRIQISSMTGQVGGGELSIGGAVTYRPSLQFTLAVQGKSVRVRYPTGLRTLLDGNLSLAGNLRSSTLTGRVLIDNLSFTPDFDLATFSDQFSSSASTPAQPGFADTVNLAVAVQSKENLSSTSSQISIAGNVDLRVSGTAADPVITGRTNLTSGELFYRSNRYELQRGVITFADPSQTNPDLNVSVGTTVEQYKLTINLRGTLDKLTTSYVSDPPLATTDIIHLIAFGNTSSESAANSASQSTDSMLASSAIGTGVSSGIQKLAGLSSLQFDPLLGGSNQNPSARIALQQRVTKDFLFTFSTDVSQPGEELVQGDYQISKRWSVTVTRDQVGGVSVAGRLHTKF